MEYTDKIREILEAQRTQVQQLEQAVNSLTSLDLAHENDRLQTALAEAHDQLASTRQKFDALSEENDRIKNALLDQMLSQKLSLIGYSRKQMDLYFTNNEADAQNKLLALEVRLREQTRRINAAHDENLSRLGGFAQEDIRRLEEKIKIAAAEVKSKDAENRDILKKAAAAAYETQGTEPITEKQLAKRLKVNSLEMKFGSRVANVAGMGLILLGVIFGLQYTYAHFLRTNEAKGFAAFALGAVFLATGELLSRKTRLRGVFSTGLSAGGVAILFSAAALSHFNLQILPSLPTLSLCVLITALAFFLSVRYNARVIAVFALLGGYLPVTALPYDAYSLWGSLFYFMLFYFLLLNLFTLILAFRKHWRVLTLFSFALQWSGMLYLYARFSPSLSDTFCTSYLPGVFLMYIVAVFAKPVRAKTLIGNADLVLISMNTAFNCLTIYFLLNKDGDFNYNGLLAALFLVIYFIGGKLLNRFMPHDKRASVVFYLTAFVFAVLVVPFQYGVKWLAMGWLVEGVAAACYGIWRKEKWFEKAGLMMFGFCLASFFLLDVLFGTRTWDLFFFKSSCVTAGLIALLTAYLRTYDADVFLRVCPKGKLIKGYQFLLVMYVYLYLMHATLYVYHKYPIFHKDLFTLFLGAMLVTFLYAFAIRRVKWIADRPTKLFSLVITAMGFVCLLWLNTSSLNFYYRNIQLITLILFNAFTVGVFYDFALCITDRGDRLLEWSGIGVSGFALVLTMIIMTRQFHFGPRSMVLSALLMAMAVGWILFGFVRGNKKTRLAGLSLALFTTAKLFLLDLAFLQNELRILSYFVFGSALVGISFAYQFFTKKFDADDPS